MILNKTDSYIGILLEYNIEKTISKEFIAIQKKNKPENQENRSINIGFIGAGSFAQNYLLPNIKHAKMVLPASAWMDIHHYPFRPPRSPLYRFHCSSFIILLE